LHVIEDHQNLVIIDTAGFEASSVLESPHPYESDTPTNGVPHIIFSATVTVPDAAYFMVNFDDQSEVYFNDALFIYDNAQDRNVLFEEGANRFPGVNLRSLEIEGPSFYVEFRGSDTTTYSPTTLAMNTYGFKLYVTPVMRAPDPSTMTVFEANKASNNGGAVFMTFGNSFPLVVHTLLKSNRAEFGGGAVYMTNANTGVVFHTVNFSSNEAGGDGGAIFYSMSHFGHQFRTCSFSGNTAVGEGGAVMMSTANGEGTLVSDNEVHFNACVLTNNSAASGGAVGASISNVIRFSGCELAFNSAVSGSGGAIVAVQYNSITLQNTLLHSNTALRFGGGIDTVLFNRVSLENVIVTRNIVNTCGGGLSIRGSSTVSFLGDCVFEANRANSLGGAIGVMSSAMWSQQDGRVLVLRDNSATRGSAVFFAGLHASSAHPMRNINMTNNTASLGGTVFWLYDASMNSEPPGLQSPSVVFADNTGLYGVTAATQALQLIAPAEYSVHAYGAVLDPPIALHMVDFYDQVVRIDGFTSVAVTPLDPQEDHCNSMRPFVSGDNTMGAGVTFVHGVAEFDHLAVNCYPNGSLILQFDAHLGNLADIPAQLASAYYLKNFTTMHFRECVTGEIYVDGTCVACPPGSYSLEERVTRDTVCQPCLSDEGVDACWADQVIVSEVR
jgi:hypothetical protein